RQVGDGAGNREGLGKPRCGVVGEDGRFVGDLEIVGSAAHTKHGARVAHHSSRTNGVHRSRTDVSVNISGYVKPSAGIDVEVVGFIFHLKRTCSFNCKGGELGTTCDETGNGGHRSRTNGGRTGVTSRNSSVHVDRGAVEVAALERVGRRVENCKAGKLDVEESSSKSNRGGESELARPRYEIQRLPDEWCSKRQVLQLGSRCRKRSDDVNEDRTRDGVDIDHFVVFGSRRNERRHGKCARSVVWNRNASLPNTDVFDKPERSSRSGARAGSKAEELPCVGGEVGNRSVGDGADGIRCRNRRGVGVERSCKDRRVIRSANEKRPYSRSHHSSKRERVACGNVAKDVDRYRNGKRSVEAGTPHILRNGFDGSHIGTANVGSSRAVPFVVAAYRIDVPRGLGKGG